MIYERYCLDRGGQKNAGLPTDLAFCVRLKWIAKDSDVLAYTTGSLPGNRVRANTPTRVRIPFSPLLGTNANPPRFFFVGEAIAFVFILNEMHSKK